MDTRNYLRTLARANTLTKYEQWADAVILWEQVTGTNPVNGAHWDRLAQARYHSGDYPGAAAAYEQVLSLGLNDVRDTLFPGEVAVRAARCLARAGDPDGALDRLRLAVNQGLRDLPGTRDHEDFATLREDPRFAEILGLPDVAGLARDDGLRADLRLFAREVKRRSPAPFRYTTEADFDAAVAELHDAVPHRSDAQVMTGLWRLLQPLGDGHSSVEAPDGSPLRNALPLQLNWFEEGWYVTACHPKYGDLLGTQVLALAGTPIEDAVAALKSVTSLDNDQQMKLVATMRIGRTAVLHALGLIPDPDTVEVTARRPDGATMASSVTATPDGAPRTKLPCPASWNWFPETLDRPLPHYLRNCGVTFWHEWMPAYDLLYAQVNNMFDHPDESLAGLAERLVGLVEENHAQRLVLDLRHNTGGNTFLARKLVDDLVGCRQVNRRGHLFVVVGRRTFSAAQNTATMLDLHTEAVFVGEPTGSSPNFLGETTPFALPYSGFQVNISDLLWQTSWPLDSRTWIAPEIYTPPTFAAYRENRDVAMEAILDCVDGDRPPGW